MELFALLVAGGSGTRMGTAVPKQFLPVGGKPVLVHSILAFRAAYENIHIILVLPKAFVQTGTELLEKWIPSVPVTIAEGGETRFHSVRNGLELVPDGALCFVHDAVRCLVSPDLIKRCGEQALLRGNAVPAIACTDSLRLQSADGSSKIVDRSLVRLVQTPQTFLSTSLKQAFRQPYSALFTDEASVLESTGAPIHLAEGEPTNIKITTPLDLAVAEQLLASRT